MRTDTILRSLTATGYRGFSTVGDELTRCLMLGENSFMIKGQTLSFKRKLNSGCWKKRQKWWYVSYIWLKREKKSRLHCVLYERLNVIIMNSKRWDSSLLYLWRNRRLNFFVKGAILQNHIGFADAWSRSGNNNPHARWISARVLHRDISRTDLAGFISVLECIKVSHIHLFCKFTRFFQFMEY